MKPIASPAAGDVSWAAVWAPWLAAPLFALLPIGGCGVAAALGSSPRVAPAVTATTPAVPVLTVVTLADRQMARHAAAD